MNTTIHPNATGALPAHTSPGKQPAAGNRSGAPQDGRVHATPIPAGDQVQFTASARAIDAASHAADAPMDTQRVDQLRQAIADGTYQVNPQRIADRLIALEKQIG